MVALLLLGVASQAATAYQDPLRYPYPANYPELPQGSDDLEEEYATSVAQENYRRGLELGETEDEARTDAKAALKRRMNKQIESPPDFEGLVIGCTDADVCT